VTVIRLNDKRRRFLPIRGSRYVRAKLEMTLPARIVTRASPKKY
jgi:hypothetical protein